MIMYVRTACDIQVILKHVGHGAQDGIEEIDIE